MNSKNLHVLFIALFSILSIVSFANKIFAAEIIFISTKNPFFIINEGSDQGLKKGDEICIVDGDGGQVLCAVINIVKNDKAVVPVKKEDLRLLKKGMKVNLPEKQEEGALSEEIKQPPEKKPSDNKKKITKPAKTKAKGRTFTVDLGYTYSPLLPYSYNIVKFDAQAESNKSGSYFAKDTAVKSMIIGVSLGFQYHFSDLFRVASSFKYGYMPKTNIEADGNTTDKAYYAKSTFTTSAIGVVVDTFWQLFNAGNFGLNVGPGLEYDKSTLKFTCTRMHDTKDEKTELGSSDSDLSIFSGRIVTKAEYLLNPVVFAGNLSLIVPLASTMTISTKANVDAANPQRDYIDEAIDHRRSSFAAEVTISAGLTF